MDDYGYKSVQDKEIQAGHTRAGVKEGVRVLTPKGRNLNGQGRFATGRGSQTPSESGWKKLIKKRKEPSVSEAKKQEKRALDMNGNFRKELEEPEIPWKLVKIDLPERTEEEKQEHRQKIKLLQIFGPLDLPSPSRSPSSESETKERSPFQTDSPMGVETPEWVKEYDPNDPFGLKKLG